MFGLKNKVYAYENSEGDKGIIVAKSIEKAEEIFKKEYPGRKIVHNMEDYWNNGAFLFEVGQVKKNTLYTTFPW